MKKAALKFQREMNAIVAVGCAMKERRLTRVPYKCNIEIASLGVHAKVDDLETHKTDLKC